MIDLSKIKSINDTLDAFFSSDSARSITPAKDLMPAFIKAGVFTKDIKNGKPIRDILRELDKADQLKLIPYLHAERKGLDTYWYFLPKGAATPTEGYKMEPPSVKKEAAKQSRLLSDETYILDLCDTVLEEKSERQKRFDFLLGDLHKDGVSRTKLPVDAFYPRLKLVIEFNEAQHTEPLSIFDKPNILTVSGVNRQEQRRLYSERKATLLPEHGIKFVEIPYELFTLDGGNKIIRNSADDMARLREKLGASTLFNETDS